METETLEEFFCGIDKQLQARQQEVNSAVKNFFDELAPRIKVARELDRERDRIFAYRFNVLDYLRTDESGLSGIIADLMSPESSHGQGKLFLETFLKLLSEEKSFDVDLPCFDIKSVKVVREKIIDSGRKIDIYVTMRDKEDNYCLAIENKPYAKDQESQITDYLDHLKEENYEYFLLIYLSSRGQRPSESSLPRSEYEKWKGRFKIMAYCNNPETGKNETELDDIPGSFYISFSLVDWLKECRKNCEVNRLRSFLLDAENFAKKKFGDSIMANSSELEAVKKFIISNPNEYLNTARIIHESYPAIKRIVCKNFINMLREEIEGKIKIDSSLSGCELFEHASLGPCVLEKNNSCICIYMGPDNYHKNYHKKEDNFNDWNIGVAVDRQQVADEKYMNIANNISDMTESKKNYLPKNESRNKGLYKGDNYGYPFYFYMNSEMKDWDSIIDKLNKEVKEGGGDISEYYVNSFIRVAKTFISIMDEFEDGETGHGALSGDGQGL